MTWYDISHGIDTQVYLAKLVSAQSRPFSWKILGILLVGSHEGPEGPEEDGILIPRTSTEGRSVSHELTSPLGGSQTDPATVQQPNQRPAVSLSSQSQDKKEVPVSSAFRAKRFSRHLASPWKLKLLSSDLAGFFDIGFLVVQN